MRTPYYERIVMSEIKGFTAIEINSPAVHDLMLAFDPTWEELDYEKDLHGNFLVLNFPEKGKYAIVLGQDFGDYFDHIETGAPKLKTVTFIKK